MRTTPLLTSMFAERTSSVPVSFIREILKTASDPSMISFAGGLPNADYFPVFSLSAAAEKVLKQDGRSALQYSTTEGFYPLRQYISERYKLKRGLDIPPENILITNGSQQALDLVGKLFLDPGDKVLLERPSYLGAIQSLSVFQPEFHEIELEEDGVNTERLEEILWEQNIKMFYCIPNFQNPTGISYSDEKRKKVAQIIRSYPMILVEDDPYGDISFQEENIPNIKYYNNEQTVLLGSFSKIVAPGMRLGWVAADKEIIQKLAILKQASDLHSNFLSQRIMYQYLRDHSLDKHLGIIRMFYKRQRDYMIQYMEQYFPSQVSFTHPEGGLFVWVTLPEHIDARDVLQLALKEKIVFVPGDTFYANDAKRNTFRMNYSNTGNEAMEKAIAKLGKILHALLGLEKRVA